MNKQYLLYAVAVLSLTLTVPALGQTEGHGHRDGAPASGTALPSGHAPPPEAPEANYADRIWGREAMAPQRALVMNEHGGMMTSQFRLDVAATQAHGHDRGYRWNGEAWLGSDLHRLVLKADGGGAFEGDIEKTETSVLYSRPLGPYFDLQAGIRYDAHPDPTRTFAALGVEGLAPHWIELEGVLFVSTDGHVLGRIETHYDQLVTQRVVLQSHAEINVSAKDVDETVGSGLVDGEFGLRLAYQVKREIAPYVEAAWEQKFGNTARFARTAGDDVGSTHLAVGLNLWI